MAKEWAKAFYNSDKWQQCRNSYIAERMLIDGGMCEVCHENLGHIVHHKKHLTSANISDPDVALNHDNLSYECKDCHDKHEGHGIKNRRNGLLVRFDSNGQPVPLPPKNKTGV